MQSEQDKENRARHYSREVQVSIPKLSAGKQPEDQQEEESTSATTAVTSLNRLPPEP